MEDRTNPDFYAPSSINNAPIPRSRRGWWILVIWAVASLGGAVAIHALSKDPLRAKVMTAALWAVTCTALAIYAFHRTRLPSRGR
jgi:CHASE2 domain-containing sensor protein